VARLASVGVSPLEWRRGRAAEFATGARSRGLHRPAGLGSSSRGNRRSGPTHGAADAKSPPLTPSRANTKNLHISLIPVWLGVGSKRVVWGLDGLDSLSEVGDETGAGLDAYRHNVAASISLMDRDPEPMLAWGPMPIHASTPSPRRRLFDSCPSVEKEWTSASHRVASF
jgi:hypothetical protein